jgi:hypothetical protein
VLPVRSQGSRQRNPRYFDRIVAVYDPALILVYEGDNDLAGGKSVDQVYVDLEGDAHRFCPVDFTCVEVAHTTMKPL